MFDPLKFSLPSAAKIILPGGLAIHKAKHVGVFFQHLGDANSKTLVQNINKSFYVIYV